MMDARMQVKQYVGVVENGRGASFMVFETGDSKFYLFSQLDPDGCATTLMFPVRKTELHPEVKRALRHGYSFSMRAFKKLQELTGLEKPGTLARRGRGEERLRGR